MGHANPKWIRKNSGTLAGVCEGIGKSLNINPIIIRILWVCSIFFVGTGIMAYIICAIAMPKEDRIYESRQERVLGVCHNLSEQFNLEVGVVRIVAIYCFLFSLGSASLLYIILFFIIPHRSSNYIAS